jgi:hypothetical protein
VGPKARYSAALLEPLAAMSDLTTLPSGIIITIMMIKQTAGGLLRPPFLSSQ